MGEKKVKREKGKGGEKMKMCVTAMAGDLNAQVDPRFGRCKYFVFVDPDTMTFEAMPNDAIAAPGAGTQAAQTIVNRGVDVLISGNIGPNAFQVLSTAGAKVAAGAYGTVKEAIEMYNSGRFADASGGSFCRRESSKSRRHKSNHAIGLKKKKS